MIAAFGSSPTSSPAAAPSGSCRSYGWSWPRRSSRSRGAAPDGGQERRDGVRPSPRRPRDPGERASGPAGI